MKICINGKFYNKEEAKISVFDHGFLYGDGVFDTVAAINGKIWWLEEHIDRLLEGCNKLEINHDWSKKELIKLCEQTFQENEETNGRLNIIITRGTGEITIYDSKECKPNLIICCTKINFPPEELYNDGARLITNNIDRIMPSVKNLNFLPSVISYYNAKERGFDDALFINSNKNISEGTTFNIFIIKKGILITPKNNILNGVTREKVIDLAKKIGYEVIEKEIKLEEVYNSDEVFITGTTKRVVPIIQINDKIINNKKIGPITKNLMQEFSLRYY